MRKFKHDFGELRTTWGFKHDLSSTYLYVKHPPAMYRVAVPRFDRYHDSTALEISFQETHKIPCNITQHTYQHVNTLIHTQNMPENCSNLPLKCHILPMKNALSLEKFEKARSLCTALRKAGHKKRRENAKSYRNLTGLL